MLDGDDVIRNPEKYSRYCELYGKDNIQVKVNDKQASCLSLEKLCGKENIVIIEDTPHKFPKNQHKRGLFGGLGNLIDKFVNKK